MNYKKTTKFIKVRDYSNSDAQLILINKKDLLSAGNNSITIIDIQRKEIIKYIELSLQNGYLSSIYKLSNNRILAGYTDNYIEQLEYDEIQKELKVISDSSQKNDKGILSNFAPISIFNNNLIVAPYDNTLGDSSIIIYKLKYK